MTAASLARYEAEQPVLGYVDAYLAEFMVAEVDGRVVGMFHREGDYLHAIHVLVDAIGSDVGSALMTQAEAEGARRLEVRAFNHRARRFYERRGYKAIAEEAAEEMGTPCTTIIMERA